MEKLPKNWKKIFQGESFRDFYLGQKMGKIFVFHTVAALTPILLSWYGIQVHLQAAQWFETLNLSKLGHFTKTMKQH